MTTSRGRGVPVRAASTPIGAMTLSVTWRRHTCLVAAGLALLLLAACAPAPPHARAGATATPGNPSPGPTVSPTPPPDPAAQLPGWTLVWDEEFTAPHLDTTKWTVVSDAPGGFQICCLTSGLQAWAADDVSLSEGTLHLTTERRAFQGKAYTSGAVVSLGKFDFLYGRLDIRARLPKGKGFFPAFWLLPSNYSNGYAYAPYEVDVMEQLGQDPYTDYMVHWWGRQREHCQYTGPNFAASYHVFTVVWTQTALTWLIDGVQRCRFTHGIPTTRMYIILNTRIGGNWPVPPDASTVLPQSTDIDYVRVYAPA
jgi:beta-glucanase (GH16 family)